MEIQNSLFDNKAYYSNDDYNIYEEQNILTRDFFLRVKEIEQLIGENFQKAENQRKEFAEGLLNEVNK
jgi:hypothetical protein